jgi:O-antigen/teichoic acid export membrane protein
MGSAAIWWCNALVVQLRGYAELAVFSAVNTLRLAILFLPVLVGRVASPLLNSLRAGGESEAYRRTFWQAVAANGAMAAVFAIVLAVAGPNVLRLFGRDFIGSGALIPLLMASVTIEVVAAGLYQAIFTSRSLWSQAAVMSIWSGVLAGISSRAVPAHGAAGLALAYLVAWSLATLLYVCLVVRELRGRTPLD